MPVVDCISTRTLRPLQSRKFSRDSCDNPFEEPHLFLHISEGRGPARFWIILSKQMDPFRRWSMVLQKNWSEERHRAYEELHLFLARKAAGELEIQRLPAATFKFCKPGHPEYAGLKAY